LNECLSILNADERVACYDRLAEVATGKGAANEAETWELTGQGSVVTQPITMDRLWSLAWETDDYAVSFELLSAEKNLIKSLGVQMTPGSGEKKELNAGTYRIRVGGSGNWRLTAEPE
jgi:hypothetical protein